MAATASNAERPSLPKTLLDEAHRLGVDVGQRSEEQVRQAVREAWTEENRAAIESWNVWVEKNGLPLERYRAF